MDLGTKDVFDNRGRHRNHMRRGQLGHGHGHGHGSLAKSLSEKVRMMGTRTTPLNAYVSMMISSGVFLYRFFVLFKSLPQSVIWCASRSCRSGPD